jgi:hypothetical protein
MPVNISVFESSLQSKLNGTTGSSSGTEFLLLSKSLNELNTGFTATVAAVNDLPAAAGNAGRIIFVTATNLPYYSNGTSWNSISGTVSSISVSGGTTGLTTTGGPITASGTITLTGTLTVANGGTGATTESGARTALGVPSLTGTGASGSWGISVTGTASNVTGVVAAANGGTGITSPGAAGNVLTSDGTAWVSTPVQGLPTANIVSGTTQQAVALNHYILVNAAATTVTLPATPSLGDVVWVTVANGRTDNVIARNGSNIQSLAENLTINAAYAAVQLRYADATRGWVFT